MTELSSIAGLSLIELREFYRSELFDHFLPFMDRHLIDREFGGFMCHADRDGTLLSTEKVTWYVARGVWVYSFLYSNFGHTNRGFLDVARQALDLLLKIEPAEPGAQWPKRFSREGNALTPPDPEIYGNLFIAEGLTAYSAATGEDRWLVKAKEILRQCLRFYDSPNYAPEIGQTYLGPSAKAFPGARVLGVSMISLRLASQMLELGTDSEIQAIADRSLDALLHRHLHPEFGLVNELLAHDFSRDNDFSQLVYIGHAIEAMWMVMFEALRRNDAALWNTAARLFRRHVEVAWDDVYDGVFRNIRDVESNVWDVDKVLWEQLEVLIGCLTLVEHADDAWAADRFARMFRYVNDRFRLERHGLPLYMFTADRKVTFTPHSDRIENYHLPRYLMMSLLSIERMLSGET